MDTHPALTVDGDVVTLSSRDVRRLRAGLRGGLLTPDDPAYDDARRVWNGIIDRRPALVAVCAGPLDVTRAVDFAREHRLTLSVRGGGRGVAGAAVRDGGLLLDLSPMRLVHIDPLGLTAFVEAGCPAAAFDYWAQAHGLATPLGSNPTTGVAGLALGGGFGWLSRKHGLTVDNLVAVDVVTADGVLVHASESNHPDLFWAVRGGGGNFGVVTSMEFRLHPVGPDVLAGLVVYPLADAPAVLRHYRDVAASLPDEAAVWAVLRKAPAYAFIPEGLHGREVVMLAAFYAGDLDEGERVLAPLRRFGRPVADVVRPQPYVGWQQAFDTLHAPGARNYWDSHGLSGLHDGLIDTLVDYAGRLPSAGSEVVVAQLGGQVARVPAGATAYAHRDAPFVLSLRGRWDGDVAAEAVLGWTGALSAAAAPFATGGAYGGLQTGGGSVRVRAAYGPNHERLARVKGVYDPGNVFRPGLNVRPAVPA